MSASACTRPDDEERKESDGNGVTMHLDEARLPTGAVSASAAAAAAAVPTVTAPAATNAATGAGTLASSAIMPTATPEQSSSAAAAASGCASVPSPARAAPTSPAAAAAANLAAASHPAPFDHFPRQFDDASTGKTQYQIRVGHVLIYRCPSATGYRIGVPVCSDHTSVSERRDMQSTQTRTRIR